MLPRALRFSVIGALLGAVLSTWLAPKMIAWYFTPPVEFGINCNPPIVWALHRMQLAQATGVFVGFILFLVLFMVFSKRQSKEVNPFTEPTS